MNLPYKLRPEFEYKLFHLPPVILFLSGVFTTLQPKHEEAEISKYIST